MAITPEQPENISPPNDLNSEAQGTVTAPNNLTAEPAGSVDAPNTLSAEPVGTFAVPNTLSAQPAGTVVAPNTLSALDAQPLPRTLCPLVSLDFANDLYAQYGQGKNLADIATFTRASTGTFINRQLNNLNQWEYFVDTAANDVLRREYNPETGENLGALIEGGSTNLALYSEQFDNAAWVKSGVAVTPNYGIAPDGTQNANRLIFDGVDKRILQSFTLGNASTASFWVKGNAGETIRVAVPNGAAENKTLTGKWQRVENRNGVAGGASEMNLSTFGGATARDMLVWGAQLEELPFASSYIPTLAAPVVRARDDFTITNTTILDANAEQSIITKFNITSTVRAQRPWGINDFSFYYSRIKESGGFEVINGVTLGTVNNSELSGIIYYAQKPGERTVGKNNITTTDNSGVYAIKEAGAQLIRLGNSAHSQSTDQAYYGHIGLFSYYNLALTQQEINQL
tara:strand:- start:17082 stop:18452 length:1371 start_codon:yes stop_codon:yes gene_type:complete